MSNESRLKDEKRDAGESGIESQLPIALVKPRRRSMLWILPVLATIGLGYVLWSQYVVERGPKIEIRFDDASGVRVGTSIMYRGVRVGVVRDIVMEESLDGVRVFADLFPNAEGLTRSGTRFWVVHPQVSLKKIAGLETLLGPNYIEARPGPVGGEISYFFDGFKAGPEIDVSEEGSLRVILTADRLGTLAPGNPVLYREIQVGSVRGAQLNNDATKVLVSLDIDPKYAPLVHKNTRFWRSGGVGVNFGIFSGLSVQADSLEAAISSSVSFATPTKKMGERSQVGDVFELSDQAESDWLKWSPVIDIGG